MCKLQETVIVVLKCIRVKCYQCCASIKMALFVLSLALIQAIILKVIQSWLEGARNLLKMRNYKKKWI